jgi:peroxiredoxin
VKFYGTDILALSYSDCVKSSQQTEDSIIVLEVDKNTFVTIDESRITSADASEVKLISGKNADGSETVGVRSQNTDMGKTIVIFRYVGLDKVGSNTVLFFENADKSLLEFRTSPVYENGFAAFEVPFVNANYKVISAL